MTLFFIFSFSLVIITNLELVSPLECRYCSSTDFNSPCRLGTEENTKTCDPKEGDDACYEEYLLGKKRRDVPLYRRGCAPKNWCDTQKNTHGSDLKDCKTCQGDKCNKDVFGSNDSSTFMCRECNSKEPEGSCRYGMDLQPKVCPSSQKLCVAYYVSTDRSDTYTRECASETICDKLGQKYAHSLEKCITCEYELCNNLELPLRFS